LSFACRIHALGLEHRGSGGTRERFDQGNRPIFVLRRCAHAPGIDSGVLDFLRQRTDQGHAFRRHDLADLVDAEFGFAAANEVGHVAALLELCLRPDLIGNAQLLQQIVDIDAA